MKTFKEELQEYLNRTGERPYKLAERAGVSMVSLYGFIKNQQDLRLQLVEKLKVAMKEREAA